MGTRVPNSRWRWRRWAGRSCWRAGGAAASSGPPPSRPARCARTSATTRRSVAARFPVAAPGTAAAFREVGPRHGDFAIVAAAAIVDSGGATLAIGGVADTPAVRRLPRLDGDALADALNEFAWELGGGTDMHATAEYRRALARRLGAAVIREARDALDRG